jgi:hypothetical protein
MSVDREVELYAPVRDFLAAQGYTVRGEVHGCDVVAARAADLVVVELKRHLTVGLLAQAVRRQKLTDTVYVAIPRPATSALERRLRELLPLLRRLEVGLLAVDVGSGTVEVRVQPVAAQRRREPRRARALLAEVAGRSADETPGGTRSRPLMTAYRESAVFVAVALERAGPSTPAALRAVGTGPRTLAILRRNSYGWFERVDRGVYQLTTTGAGGLGEWAATADRKRALLAATAEPAAPEPATAEPASAEPARGRE